MISTGTSSLSNSLSWDSLISIGELDSSFKDLVNHRIDVLLQQAASWTLH